VAVTAPCRARAISPTRGSHRSVTLCLTTTRSRAPPQDPKCGGDRQTDEMCSVSQTGRKLRLSRQFYPKPTCSNGAGQVVLIDRPTQGGRVRLGPEIRRCSFPGPRGSVARPDALRPLWRIVLRSGGPKSLQNQYCCGVVGPPGGERSAPAHALWRRHLIDTIARPRTPHERHRTRVFRSSTFA
jgi:hypothetical protein